MKTAKCLGGTIFIVAFVAGAALGAESNMAGSKHDMRLTNSNRELCLPCHTPHGGDETVGYLWNHAYQPASAFTTWENATLGDESLMCMGCHDGQTVRDNYGGGKNSAGYVLVGPPAIGTDLTDDHPVGVEYPNSSRYAEKTTGEDGDPVVDIGDGKHLPLYRNATTGRDQVECATCHAVHNHTKDYLLRYENTGSALCLGCHAAW